MSEKPIEVILWPVLKRWLTRRVADNEVGSPERRAYKEVLAFMNDEQEPIWCVCCDMEATHTDDMGTPRCEACAISGPARPL